VKFSVLALDYDGTIARDGHVHPSVVSAIRDTRARGVVVVLVTGRTLFDLRPLLSKEVLFDVIVVENGAVLAFSNGMTRLLGHSPPQALLDELRHHHVDFSFGDCVIEADASAAPKILEAVRKLELPLMLAFNHGRMMVLPQGINKASGLREALNTMRLSLHNCLGIGNAENDHALLQACEVGVAVAWGSESLQKIADYFLPGTGPEATAEYIRKVTAHKELPLTRADNRSLRLGETRDGPLNMAIHGQNVLIAGDPRSGKSWITGLFCEHLILQGYCLCMIDPEGDYATLASLPGVVVFGGEEPPPRLSDVARALRYPDISVIIDLSAITHDEKLAYVAKLLPMLVVLRKQSGLPHWIIVDEAHYFLTQADDGPGVISDLTACILISYLSSHLPPQILNAMETIIATPLTNPEEVQNLVALCGAHGAEKAWSELLGQLGIDEAAVLPREKGDGRLPQRFTIAPRATLHVRHRAKYLEVPIPEQRAFYFTHGGQPIARPARTLKEFITMLQQLPPDSVKDHARHGDFSRWIAKVFGDQPLATDIRTVEQGFCEGRIENLAESLAMQVRERYGL
jgi:hydroxymethylpyrimidine pyrophosphatase-like HAD family hydrolase